ncbi:MAG TPA: hypothetical protein VM661_11165 [Candidatus Sulfotelmatobacter sp.]|jgi:hypothetical protein|nr:hypothetical protein [Candidatus Sulfotelmatobacter sp.]
MRNKGRLEQICRMKGCTDTQILECASESGNLKELLFCHKDGCFVVKMNGHERLRTDTPSAAERYYDNLGKL